MAQLLLRDHVTLPGTWLKWHLSPDLAPVFQPPPTQVPHHTTTLNPGQCTQPFTQGYFVAFSLFGQEGTKKYWLDQKLAHIAN